MRLEATVSEARGDAVVQLADELGLTKSQLIDEALTLFLTAVMEVRRGRRLMTIDQDATQPAREIITPTLSMMEWAMQPQPLSLPPAAVKKIAGMAASPPKAGARLRASGKRHPR